MRFTSPSLPAAQGPARRLAAFGTGLLGLGLLTGCPQAAPPAAVVDNTNRVYEVVPDTVYTGRFQATILSPGTYADGRRVPDLLLTVLYRQDPATGDLVTGTTTFVVQPDGPVAATLRFPGRALATRVAHRVCSFRVNVDFEFGAGSTNPFGISVSENPAAEQGEEGRVLAPTHAGQGPPAPLTVIHVRIVGVLNLRTKTLEAVAETTGPVEVLRHN